MVWQKRHTEAYSDRGGMSYRLVRRIGRSAGIGALLAFLVGILAFVFGAKTAAVTAYLKPVTVLGGFVSPMIPHGVVYWVAPEGGPYAFLLITLACASFFWSTLLAGMHFFWSRAKHA